MLQVLMTNLRLIRAQQKRKVKERTRPLTRPSPVLRLPYSSPTTLSTGRESTMPCAFALQAAVVANRLHNRQLAFRFGENHHGFFLFLQAESPLAERFFRADTAAVQHRSARRARGRAAAITSSLYPWLTSATII